MELRDVYIELFDRIDQHVASTIDGLDAEQLHWTPESGVNSIGWLVWHLTRVQDSHIAELLDDGALVRHIRRVSAMYRSRRDVLLDTLRAAFGEAITVDPPPGGMALWCRVGEGAAAWARAARSHGVGVQPGQDFSFEGEDLPFLRLGFACLDEGEIREAVARLARPRPLNHR